MADGGGYGIDNGVGDVDGRVRDGNGKVGDGRAGDSSGDGNGRVGDGRVGDGNGGGAGRGGRPYVLLVAGLRGQAADTPRMLAALDRFVQSAAAGASGVILSAIVAANPDALAGGDWEPGAAQRVNLAVGYPPDGGFYFDETAPERRYLWRWICYQAPDLVVEVALSDDADGGVSSDRGSSGRAESGVAGAAARWAANAAAAGGVAAQALDAVAMADDDSLVSALGRAAADAPGTIPGLRLTTHWTGLSDGLRALWRLTGPDADLPASAARRALDGRRSRTPLGVGRILAGRYGHTLDPINYTQGVGISGRLQLAALDASYDEPAGGGGRIVSESAEELAGVAGGIVSEPVGELAGGSGGIVSESAGELAGVAEGIASEPAGELAGAAGGIVSDPAIVSELAGELAGAAGGIVSDPAIVSELAGELAGGGGRIVSDPAIVSERAGELDGIVGRIVAEPAAHLAEVGGAALAGVVWASDLYEATGSDGYRDTLLYAADRFAARGPGQAPAPCDPDFRVEDMFYAGAMLGRAFQVTGDARYADLLAYFLVDGGDVQEDNGLFRHARSAPFYWSRGNGFAALGYAEALTYLPASHPAYEELGRRHQRHLDALLRRQQPWGTFGELVDVPGAWGELTATAMIGYALARGLRSGRLPAAAAAGYATGLALCWRAVSERVDDAGGVVDGCISTGVMPDLRAYLHRPAVSRHDDRTGSLALWFACEMERLGRAGMAGK